MDISFQETGVVKQKEDIIIRRGIVHILDLSLIHISEPTRPY